MKRPIVEEVKKHVRALYQKSGKDDILRYHNWEHTKRMSEQARDIALHSGLSEEEADKIEVAALFHDVCYLIDYKNHEETGAKLAMDFLDSYKCDKERISEIKKLIMTTCMKSVPQTLPEKIMKDADMSHLGGKSYLIDYYNLLEEMRKSNGMQLTDKEWRAETLKFMKEHTYYTDYARAKYGEQKKQNIKTIEEMDVVNEEVHDSATEAGEPKKGKKKKKDKKAEIPEKGIETMFRVALRNHVNLSRIADNKANTLISVNAIIISIVLSTLFPKLDTNPFLIYPGFSLLGFSIITMVISIFSTVPKTTHGKLSRQAITEREGNLLFFGNFHSMSQEDFEWGISEVMNDKNYLYKNLTRDLYFLGKVLNRKYKLLRYSYASFVLGLFVSILLFVLSV